MAAYSVKENFVDIIFINQLNSGLQKTKLSLAFQIKAVRSNIKKKLESFIQSW